MEWKSIGSDYKYEYQGQLDGKNHKIVLKNITYPTWDKGIVVGYLGDGGSIKNIGIEADIVDRFDTYEEGILCGSNSGAIDNCYVIGQIEKNLDSTFGVICGNNYGTIINSHNSAQINALEEQKLSGSWIGGICGNNIYKVINCYNKGEVKGGIAAQSSEGIFENCYTVNSDHPFHYIGGLKTKEINCYFLVSDEDYDPFFKIRKRMSDFKSGYVAYLLSQGTDGSVWGQSIGADDTPVLNGETVFCGYVSCLDNKKSYSNIPLSENISHKWNNGTITKKPTCIDEGIKTFVCGLCNKTKTETVPSTGHIWNTDFTIDKMPTCTEKGSKSIHCRQCHAIKENSIEEIAITDNHVGKTEIRNAKEATCVEKGYTGDTYCKSCNKKIKNGTLIEKSNHSWDAGKVTKQATATKIGERTYTCTVCGEIKQKEIPARGVPKKGSIISNNYGSYRVIRSGMKKATVGFLGKRSSKTSITIPVEKCWK